MIPINKRQLEVEKAKLAAEKQQLKQLKAIYSKASDDIANKIKISNGKINVLLKNFDELDDVQKSILQSQIYQRNFQQSLKKQIDGFMKELESKQYKTVSEYLKGCYDTGFIGTMYDIAGQGMPLIMPIDQKKVTKAMVHDTKLSKKLYTKLGEDVNLLKKRIANNISRGIATADSYANIARNIANGTKVGINKTMRIVRTEGHRIQNASAFDAQHAAKAAGADIVKQWSSTLDGRTRETHRQLDGQIRELDEPFEVYGMTAMYPSDFGDPAEDINCRCALLQRARSALDDEFTKMNNFTKEIETFKSPASYAEFKKGFFSEGNVKYMNYVQKMERKYGTKNFTKVLDSMTEREYKHYSKLIEGNPVFNAKAVFEIPEIKDEILLKAYENLGAALEQSNGVKSHTERLKRHMESVEYKEVLDLPVAFRYNSLDDVIEYNPLHRNYEKYDFTFAQVHELSHRMDMIEFNSFTNERFIEAVDICSKRVMERSDEIQLWFAEGGIFEDNAALSDIISALSKGKIDVLIGHSPAYWKNKANIIAETFANTSTLDLIDNETKNQISFLLKEIFDVYEEIVQ